ncbi:hypothetical protein B0H16DRAFT_1670677 [Mycena metata]|uniref:Uncharacterized protein n=1 Tax=Mycena metata TaxID=1033252 RepID=A0AAD7KK07_9AGAR|nr:hypothetical protein B0H16DRAFT_1670677 [Mycena metata]
MLNRLQRARGFVLLSFLPTVFFWGCDVLNPKDIPDSAVYTPHPYLIGVFFVIQVALQIYWISRLFERRLRPPEQALLSPGLDDGFGVIQTTDTSDNDGEPSQMAYVPLYTAANFLLVGSMAAWKSDQVVISQICMALNAICQLYFIFFTLQPSGKFAWSHKNKITHLVAKTSLGIAVLYMWRAWGVMDIGSSRPPVQQKAHCGVFVLLLAFASGPDPTLGICLLLDLAALTAGHTTDGWRFAFSCIMGVLFVVVLSDALLAWKNRAPARMPVDAEAETSALQGGSEEIWLEDFTTPSPSDEEHAHLPERV